MKLGEGSQLKLDDFFSEEVDKEASIGKPISSLLRRRDKLLEDQETSSCSLPGVQTPGPELSMSVEGCNYA